MDFRNLGTCGVKVSPVCLGTAFRGVPDGLLLKYAPEISIIEGDLSLWEKRDDGALLGEQFARRRSADSFGAEGEVRRPGAESRWSAGKDLSWVPVRPEVVAEVSYDQLTGGRFRHATRFERWRPDKDPRDCRMDQLERPRGPALIEALRSAQA